MSGLFVHRNPRGRSTPLPCRVPGCREHEVLVEHRDPILWRLCEQHQAAGAAALRNAPGLTWDELTAALTFRRRAA